MPRRYSEFLREQEEREERKACPFVPARRPGAMAEVVLRRYTDEQIEKAIAHMADTCGRVK